MLSREYNMMATTCQFILISGVESSASLAYQANPGSSVKTSSPNAGLIDWYRSPRMVLMWEIYTLIRDQNIPGSNKSFSSADVQSAIRTVVNCSVLCFFPVKDWREMGNLDVISLISLKTLSYFSHTIRIINSVGSSSLTLSSVILLRWKLHNSSNLPGPSTFGYEIGNPVMLLEW